MDRTRRTRRTALACALALLAAAGPAGAQSFPPGGLAKPSPHTPAGTPATDRGALGVPYARWAADEVLVRFRSSAGAAQRSAALATVGAKVDRVLPLPGLRTVKLRAGVSVDEAVRRFEADPRVEYAEPNYVLRNNSAPNDPDFYKQWGLHNTGQYLKGFVGTTDADIDAPEAWDMTRGETSVVVGHIDGGVAPNHSELATNLWTNADEIAGNGVDDDGNGYVDDRQGWDWTSHENTSSTSCAVGDKDPSDNNGHGTHTAGTIGAYGHNGTGVTGVAQRVSIMPLRATGQGGTGFLEDFICAFRYAVANGAKIVNASVGENFESQALQDVVTGAPNVLFVTTAGNNAQDVDVVRQWPCNLPASNILCVAATDANDNLWLDSDFFWAARPGAGSNYGDTNVDMAAPGVFIHSTSPFRSVLRDDFDNRDFVSRWTKTGNTNNRFGIEYPTSGPRDGFTLSDSTGGNYSDAVRDPDAIAQAPQTNTLGMRDCQLHYRIVDIDTEPAGADPDGTGPLNGAYDYLASELSSGGGQWSAPLGFHYSPLSKPGTRIFLAGTAFDNKNELWLRFRFHSDGSIVRDGAHVDDLDVKCTPDNKSYDATSYGVESGTSQAAPHVTGTAALMLSVKPDLAPYQLKQILMDSGDYKTSLDGKTVSGRRLNAANAVASVLPPNTELAQKPAAVTGESTAVFTFTSTQSLSEPAAGFECMLDQRDFWHDCTAGASRTYRDLTSGSYTFRVRAINRAGVKDPTPVAYTWRVDRTPPETYLAPVGRENPTGYTNAAFDFGTDDEEVSPTFECKLDAGAWEACNSQSKSYPATATGTPLAVGAHTFQVLARDKYGNPDPTPSSYSWTIAAPPAERHPTLEGWSSATSSARGDFDGDGYDDLAVGVPGEDVGTDADAGGVNVLYGTATGLSGNRSWFVSQDSVGVADVAEPGDRFGAALAAGDFNGDGRSDLAIGAPGEGEGAGTVHVLLAGTSGLAAAGSQQWMQSAALAGEPAEAGDRFGATLATGDTTGDGRAELIVGAPDEDLPGATDAGVVHLLPGAASGPTATGGKLISQAPTAIAEVPEAGDQLGAALALGDYNGDGKADLALAAPGESVETFAQAGAVHVLAGAAGGYTVNGGKLFHQNTAYVVGDAEPGDRFGSALAAGNFAGSSASELAIGAPSEDLAGADNGAVHLLMGASPGLLTTNSNRMWGEDTPYVLDTADPGDQFGAALAAGNFGGTAEQDLAIGVPGEDAAFALDSGMVTVLPGASGSLSASGSKLWTQATAYVGEDAQPGDHFGAALAAGDFGDSAEDDLVVGVPDESVGEVAGAGIVQRLPGSSTGLKALGSDLLSQASYAVGDAPEAGDGFGAALGR